MVLAGELVNSLGALEMVQLDCKRILGASREKEMFSRFPTGSKLTCGLAEFALAEHAQEQLAREREANRLRIG
jgi:hypothetical protein